MAAIARWCLRHRLVVVLLWLLALGGTAAGATLAGSAYSNDYEVPGTESGRATALLDRGFHGLGGDSDTIVWHTDRGSVRADAVEQRMEAMLDKVADLPGVAAVTSPYGDARGQVSEDGHTAYATVTFDAQADDIPEAQARALVDTARAAASDDLQVELGGSAVALTEAPGGHVAEVVGVAVAAVVLFLAFGSLAASALPIATALVSVGIAYSGIVLLGHLMTVADFAPMLGMLVGLGVGIDYALFIVTRHRRGLKRGLSVAEAAETAVATTGRAVVFAGATVCIALLGMLILQLSFLNGVAIAASLTVLLTVAASVTLLPALLSFIGARALSRRERRVLAERGPQPELPTGFAARWSAFVERHPKLLGAVAVVVMGVLALPTLSLHLGTSDQGNGPATATTRQAYDLLAEGFGPGVNGPLHPGRRPRRRRRPGRPRPAAGRPRSHPGRRLRLPGHVQQRRRHRRPHRRARLLAAVQGDQRARRPAPGRHPAEGRDRHLPRRPRGQHRRLPTTTSQRSSSASCPSSSASSSRSAVCCSCSPSGRSASRSRPPS
ncbi:hypothetical protein STANM309S_03486 [Streptomyces tanashiensis]